MPSQERIEHFVGTAFGIDPSLLVRILLTAVVLFGYLLVRRVLRRIISRTLEDPSARYTAGRVSAYVAGLLAAALVAKVWVQGVTGFATYLGLVSAGLAIALQDPLVNLVGWVFILVRQPFKVGDRIQIGGHAGDVVDIRLFRFILLEIGNWVRADQSTGRVLHIPNGWVFKNPVANYDEAFGYIWNELEVVVTFDSNWRRAKDVLLTTVNEHSEQLSPDAAKRIAAAADNYHIKFSKLTPVVWTSVVDDGVKLTVRYLCKPRERRSSSSEIWESVLGAFDALDDVDLAYNTVRQYDHAREGKVPSARRHPAHG
jgi:small-conductance mechanosensitive channel